MSSYQVVHSITVALMIAGVSFGCQKFNLRSQSPKKSNSKVDEFEAKVETPLVGDHVIIGGLNMVTLEGVGLVTGLDRTGGDPPPSMYRKRLLREMKKRGVERPNRLLRSPSTALVIVRAYLPPLIHKSERFDVEIRLPGNSDATDLNGGWLLETLLAEQAIVPGQGVLKGHILAKAKGPILISTGEGDKESLAGVLRRGRILGGGISMKDRDLAIYLRNDFRSVRNAKRVADRVGRRFHSYDKHGLRQPLADTTFSDQKIILKVPSRYKNNFPRYIQVVRNIALRETSVAQRVRMQKLKTQLNDPQMSEFSALRLEAIGSNSIPILKSGLQHASLEVRFRSAEALAYLGEADGLEVLAEAARKERAFRVFALAALAVVDEPETRLLLRNLMSIERDENGNSSGSAELRYGAFRALRTLDKYDPFIRGEDLKDQFSLHELETQGEPMIHLTNRRRAEVVLFGSDQRLRTPIAVRAGNHIWVTASPGSDMINISRYEAGQPDQRKVVSSNIAVVIREVTEFGASHPDVAQMLVQANDQHNLPGRIEIDAMPQAGRIYYRPEVGNNSQNESRVGRSNHAPNMFSLLKRETRSQRDQLPSNQNGLDTQLDSGTASLADARTSVRKNDIPDRGKRFRFFNFDKKLKSSVP